jgi:hypothetical protein
LLCNPAHSLGTKIGAQIAGARSDGTIKSIDEKIYTLKNRRMIDLTSKYIKNTELFEFFTRLNRTGAEQIRKENPNRPGLGGSLASRRWFRDRSTDDKEA